jgi:hypothetical protein
MSAERAGDRSDNLSPQKDYITHDNVGDGVQNEYRKMLVPSVSEMSWRLVLKLHWPACQLDASGSDQHRGTDITALILRLAAAA